MINLKKMKVIKSKKYIKNQFEKISSNFTFDKLFPIIIKLFFIILPIFILFLKIKRKNIRNEIQNTNNLKNNIHLALNVDDKYIYPSIVFLTSLMDNRANSTFYTIHLLTNNNLTVNSTNKITRLVNKFGNNSIKLIYYNLEGYFKNATAGYISVATYYKILLPSLLPNVDKIIYSDGDVINLEDLSEMYNIEFKENMYFCGLPDYKDHLNELHQFGLSSDKYINCGILLINLKALRENLMVEKLIAFVASHHLRFHEQTAINCICYNNIQVLPYKFNLFAYPSINKLNRLNSNQNAKYRVNLSELNQSFNEPTLYHYVSLDKPWLNRTTKFNRVYWWYYAKMSGYYNEILEHYKFDINDIENLLSKIPEDGGLLRRNYKKFK